MYALRERFYAHILGHSLAWLIKFWRKLGKAGLSLSLEMKKWAKHGFK